LATPLIQLDLGASSSSASLNAPSAFFGRNGRGVRRIVEKPKFDCPHPKALSASTKPIEAVSRAATAINDIADALDEIGARWVRHLSPGDDRYARVNEF
jgi:hypothetical protein